MNDVDSKTGPLCQCFSNGDDCRFKSYVSTGFTQTEYHTIVVSAGDSKHLQLYQGGNNIIHVFVNVGGILKNWSKIWASTPVINNGDKVICTVRPKGSRGGGQTWTITVNNTPVASGTV
jgi:hypothetical protein